MDMSLIDLHLGHEDTLTPQAQSIKDKLGAVENCETRVVCMLVLAVLKSFKILGVFSWTHLTDI